MRLLNNVIVKIKRTIYRLLPYLKLSWMSDSLYLKIQYYLIMGKKLNLDHPLTYNEKLQWLKINNRNEIQTLLVDKYEVKKYVSEILDDKYLIPTLGIWNTFNEIDFDNLPDSFVLKTTHDSGGVYICHQKNENEIDRMNDFFKKRSKKNYFDSYREWPYKNVKPRFIAEKNMSINGDNTVPLIDYKFYCFNGQVDCVMVCLDREIGKPKYYFFDKKWQILPYNKHSVESTREIKKPVNMDNMFFLAEKLSEGFKHVRVDLFEINEEIYFGEYTFYSQSGMDANLYTLPNEKWGKLIQLKDD